MCIPFLPDCNLLVVEYRFFRDGRLGSGNAESGGRFVPWFPVSVRNHGHGHGCNGFPLADNNRCMVLPVSRLDALGVHRRPAAVAEGGLAVRVGSPAGWADGTPDDRFLFKGSAAAGAEPRLVINGRAAAVPAHDRPRMYYRPAAVAELCQFISNDRAAPGTDRECRLFLFGYNSAAPVAELCLVIESCVAAYTTGFCHIIPLMDKTGRNINTVMRFFAAI